MSPERNASWCYDQDGPVCGRYQGSLVPIVTRKWTEHKLTFDAEDNTTSNAPRNRHDIWEYFNETYYRCDVTSSRTPALHFLFVKPWRLTTCETPDSVPAPHTWLCLLAGDASRLSLVVIYMCSVAERKKFNVAVAS